MIPDSPAALRFDPLGAPTLISRVASFAEQHADIRAVAIVGSQDHPAHRWADIHFLIYVRDPAQYLERDAWLAALGEARARWHEATAAGDAQWLVTFGGVDAYFVFSGVAPLRAKLAVLTVLHASPWLGRLLSNRLRAKIDLAAEAGSQALDRCIQVLCDKDRTFPMMKRVLRDSRPWMSPPRDFEDTVSEFWCPAEKDRPRSPGSGA